MRWIDDASGRFAARPFFDAGELDDLGAALAREALRRRGRPGRPQLDTDTLLCLLETQVGDLDLFADLDRLAGTGVEAVTEFRPGRAPVVRVERRLAADPRRRLRLRFTLAHELGHVVLHRELWDARFAQPAFRGLEPAHPARAGLGAEGRGASGGPSRVDWLEWQATYLAGALLVPAPVLAGRLGGAGATPARGAAGRPVDASPEGDRLVGVVARLFEVSTDAATVRLRQLGWLRERACAAQRRLWAER